MSNAGHLAAALSDRYRLERELGAGGMVTRSAAQAAARHLPLKRRSAAHHGAAPTTDYQLPAHDP